MMDFEKRSEKDRTRAGGRQGHANYLKTFHSALRLDNRRFAFLIFIAMRDSKHFVVMRPRHIIAGLVLGVFCTFWSTVANAAEVNLSDAIRARLEALREPGAQVLAGEPIAAAPLLHELYRLNGYRPLWRDAENREVLVGSIAASDGDGLAPSDFHYEALTSLISQFGPTPLEVEDEATRDILMSDALARLSYQLFYGKVRPEELDPDWNVSRPLLERSPAQVLLFALETTSLPQLLAELRMDHPYYQTLKAALRSHREMASAGGWPQVATGKSLKNGMTGERVSQLRRRLTASGDYDAAGISDPLVFDAPLETAVRRFQDRHGLEPDGVVGKKTIEELNVPVESRIEQIRVNLERARWVLRNLDQDFVIVNIAGFYLRLVRDGEPVWHTPVIVGTPFRKTPVFTASISYLEFNPTWTVPPTILEEDVLPNVKADFGYLAKNGFLVTDFERRPVDATAIDWDNADAKAFPYLIVQQPGPANALGLVKFMLPNSHAVYLHDTPSRGLFKSASRTFSSGCIRVQDPFHFAALLLKSQESWDRNRIDSLVESRKTATVHLPEPLPVLLLYWTVDPDPSGNVRFYRDVYGRDRNVLKALNADFRPEPKS